MKITFTQPITVGDLQNRISITSMQLKSLSFNFAGPKGAPNVLVSVVLTDPESGYDAYFSYEDAAATAAFATSALALQFAGSPWPQQILQRLQQDGKLPEAPAVGLCSSHVESKAHLALIKPVGIALLRLLMPKRESRRCSRAMMKTE